jgi:hypothetical protein
MIMGQDNEDVGGELTEEDEAFFQSAINEMNNNEKS